MLLAEQQNGVVMAEGANRTKPLPHLGIISYLDAHTSWKLRRSRLYLLM